jgi:uncharacterized protein (DUF4213/DUF364 family)
MADRILPAVFTLLRERGAISAWTLDRVTVGERTILVELVDDVHNRRLGGLAHRPAGSGDSVTAEDIEALLDPIETVGDADRIDLATAVATLNALSEPYIEWHRGDPMELLPSGVETVVTVGLFKPAMRKFDDIELRIIEREACPPPSQEGVAVSMFTPAEAKGAMEAADVIFITGSTLLYGGLNRYLDLAPADAPVILVGATASTWSGGPRRMSLAGSPRWANGSSIPLRTV